MQDPASIAYLHTFLTALQIQAAGCTSRHLITNPHAANTNMLEVCIHGTCVHMWVLAVAPQRAVTCMCHYVHAWCTHAWCALSDGRRRKCKEKMRVSQATKQCYYKRGSSRRLACYTVPTPQTLCKSPHSCCSPSLLEIQYNPEQVMDPRSGSISLMRDVLRPHNGPSSDGALAVTGGEQEVQYSDHKALVPEALRAALCGVGACARRLRERCCVRLEQGMRKLPREGLVEIRGDGGVQQGNAAGLSSTGSRSSSRSIRAASAHLPRRRAHPMTRWRGQSVTSPGRHPPRAAPLCSPWWQWGAAGT